MKSLHYVTMVFAAAILISVLDTAHAGLSPNVLLIGKRAFTGSFHCLEAPGGFNGSSGQPNGPQGSILSHVTINGTMTFDGSGHATTTGNYVEIATPASALNTSWTPGAGSGTFSIDSSAYTVAPNRNVTLTLDKIRITGLTGNNAGFSLVITSTSGQLSGLVSLNGTLLLSTSAELVQQVDLFAGTTQIATFPRMCSVSMTLIP